MIWLVVFQLTLLDNLSTSTSVPHTVYVSRFWYAVGSHFVLWQHIIPCLVLDSENSYAVAEVYIGTSVAKS